YIEWLKVDALPFRPPLQDIVEYSFPRRGVDARRIGQHAIQVEDRRVEVAPIDGDCRFAGHDVSFVGRVDLGYGDANGLPAISGAHHHYWTARLTYDPPEDRRTRRFPRSSPSEHDEIG